VWPTISWQFILEALLNSQSQHGNKDSDVFIYIYIYIYMRYEKKKKKEKKSLPPVPRARGFETLLYI
jgi:hypothetical protein